MKQIPQGMQEVMFEKSIPGQSLTNSPENSYAWEKPPQYTSVKEAREAIFLNLLEPIRLHFGSLTITHGFTSQALINKVPAGIARNLDQHCAHELNSRGNRICSRDGASADIYVRGVSAGQLGEYIHQNLLFLELLRHLE